MPVSLLPEDALQSFGIQSGLYRVVSSDWLVHQFQPNKETGKQSEPFVCWAIGYQPIDQAGKPIGDVKIDHSLKVGPKFGETVDKSKFAPAQVAGTPLPLRVGSKGPFLEAVGDQAGLYEAAKPMLYLKELYKCGFDKAKMAAANMSVGLLVGTEGEIYELVSQNDGTDESGKQFKPTKIPAFKSIRKFGYEAGAVTTMPAGAHSGAAVGANGAPAPATTSDPTALAVSFLSALIEKFKSTNPNGMPLAEMVKSNNLMFVGQKITPRPTKEDRDVVKKLLESEDFYQLEAVQSLAMLDGTEVMFA
jgi:hypothetical protein